MAKTDSNSIPDDEADILELNNYLLFDGFDMENIDPDSAALDFLIPDADFQTDVLPDDICDLQPSRFIIESSFTAMDFWKYLQ